MGEGTQVDYQAFGTFFQEVPKIVDTQKTAIGQNLGKVVTPVGAGGTDAAMRFKAVYGKAMRGMSYFTGDAMVGVMALSAGAATMAINYKSGEMAQAGQMQVAAQNLFSPPPGQPTLRNPGQGGQGGQGGTTPWDPNQGTQGQLPPPTLNANGQLVDQSGNVIDPTTVSSNDPYYQYIMRVTQANNDRVAAMTGRPSVPASQGAATDTDIDPDNPNQQAASEAYHDQTLPSDDQQVPTTEPTMPAQQQDRTPVVSVYDDPANDAPPPLPEGVR